MAGLDRRITINIQAEGEYVRGEYVPGDVTPFNVWAQQRGAGSVDIDTIGGVAIAQSRVYIVRWFQALEDATVNRVSVIAGGVTWNVENIAESSARQRFFSIETVRVD